MTYETTLVEIQKLVLRSIEADLCKGSNIIGNEEGGTIEIMRWK